MSEQLIPSGKPEKVPAFSDMDGDAKVAHLTDLHHPGTVDSARHFMTHLVGMVAVPHVHAKRTQPIS